MSKFIHYNVMFVFILLCTVSSLEGLRDRFLGSINIEKREFKKFFSLALLMFCMLFNYTILRDIKDVLINTLKGANTELVPYIKGIFVMSFAIFFTVLYMKLSTKFDPKILFYWIIGGFITFFTVFSFVLYPLQDIIHPSPELISDLVEKLPMLRFVLNIWGVWSYALFYVMAELWGGVVLSLLFWQFSNSFVTPAQSKRYYPLFGIVSNLSLILSGQVIKIICKAPDNVDNLVGTALDELKYSAWMGNLKILALTVLFFGLIAMACHRWIVVNVLPDKELCPGIGEKKSKVRMGFFESCKMVWQSKYIRYIFVLVFAYGMSINIVEVIWKKGLALRFAGDHNAYGAFMGGVSQFTGIFVVSFVILAKGLVSRFGWFVGAIITPTVMLFSGAIFLAFFIFSKNDAVDAYLMDIFGCGSLIIASIVGGFQNIFAKGAKYSLFDPTKEMAYVPLDSDLKTQAKAAIDVTGGRLGKAGGSFMWMILFTIVPAVEGVASIVVCAPYAVAVFVLVVLAWLISVKKLSGLYEKALKKD